MAVINVLYTLELKLWLSSNPFSKSFLLRNDATDTSATIAFILDIYL